jgi:23S rRNA (cytidine1920-2'-O)/16S rRNA (cytidine1409-2'-O)-methyltransferase
MSTLGPPRLDVWLVEHGLVESREKAQALVMAGRVRVDGAAAVKAGTAVRDGSVVEVVPGPQHVGRGALKLTGALETLGVEPVGRVAIDVGASTGGFTEVLLERGAARIYAVDVGRAQLHEKLGSDPRVVVLDGVNARNISTREIPEACSLAVVDVSFISALKILPALRSVLAPEADVLVLVKPQFEVGRFRVGRGGIVRDAELHLQALRDVGWAAEKELHYVVRGACPSPITGAEGNREFFLHLVRDGEALAGEAFDAMMERAVAEQ